MIRVWGAALLALAMVSAAPMHAVAHMSTPVAEFPNGFAYDSGCCSDEDCQAIPAHAVREGAARIIVTLRKGEHKALVKDVTYELTYTDHRIRESPDGRWHACISKMTFYDKKPEGNNLICIYAPPKGA